MSIEKIRNTVVDNIGNDVKIIYNEGRNKIYVYRGKVVEVYNNIFIIFDVKYDCKRSFSYYDILTNTVKMSFML